MALTEIALQCQTNYCLVVLTEKEFLKERINDISYLFFLAQKLNPSVFTLTCSSLEFFLELMLVFRLTETSYSVIPCFLYFAISTLKWGNEIM